MKLTLKMNKVVENLTPSDQELPPIWRERAAFISLISLGEEEKNCQIRRVCVRERRREHNIQIEIQKEGENHGQRQRQRQIKTEKEKEMGINQVPSGQVPVGL